MTPEQQHAADLDWLAKEIKEAEHIEELTHSSHRPVSARLRRILAALTTEQEPVRWLLYPTNNVERMRKTPPDEGEMLSEW